MPLIIALTTSPATSSVSDSFGPAGWPWPCKQKEKPAGCIFRVRPILLHSPMGQNLLMPRSAIFRQFHKKRWNSIFLGELLPTKRGSSCMLFNGSFFPFPRGRTFSYAKIRLISPAHYFFIFGSKKSTKGQFTWHNRRAPSQN